MRILLYFKWISPHKKALQLINCKAFKFSVPGTGIEPAHPCERQILSLLRLPIPPPGPLLEGGQYYNF